MCSACKSRTRMRASNLENSFKLTLRVRYREKLKTHETIRSYISKDKIRLTYVHDKFEINLQEFQMSLI